MLRALHNAIGILPRSAILAGAIMLTYGLSLKYGFSQDDWYFLRISQATSVSDVLRFFNPFTQSGFAFYRPLSTQLYYYLLGSTPWAMHLAMLILHFLNALLVAKLVRRLGKSETVATTVALLYGISAVHFLSLFYIAATQQLLAAFFSLLTLCTFLEDRVTWRNLAQSAMLFALAVLSKETALMTPLIAPILILLRDGYPQRQRDWPRLFGRLLPVLGVTGLYVIMRILSFQGVQSEYHLMLNLSILTNYRWYSLFAVGFPEELVRFGLPRMMIDFGRFASQFGWRGVALILGGGIVWLRLLVAIVTGLGTRGPRKAATLAYLLWFIISLLPVVMLRDHLYPHYLDLGLVPLLLLLIENTRAPWRPLIIGLMVAMSWLAIWVSLDVHWTIGRATYATKIQEYLAAHRDLCDHSTWEITGDIQSVREVSYVLSLENGPQVLCRNPELRVYYLGVSSQAAPEGTLPLAAKELIHP
jgi:hypothetical protein